MKAAKAADLKPGSVMTVEVGGKSLALCNADGRYFALDNTCLHRGGPIGEGFLDGNIVTCPWHGWQYDVTNGQATMNPALRLACYATKVEGDDVLIEV
ncbi:MAG TPA: non-heme iron oxygenase ferredoxin subunit [Candidatus Polarisedimenticolia bacterium]|nr:non-heme iron oxygenase ferredoxin subunit [Candidatus Polarisedimenticolia bacterium]